MLTKMLFRQVKSLVWTITVLTIITGSFLLLLEQQSTNVDTVTREAPTVQLYQDTSESLLQALDSNKKVSEISKSVVETGRIRQRSKNAKRYFVYGANCKIPQFNPWDESIADIVSEPETADCQREAPIPDLTYSHENVIFVNKTVIADHYPDFHQCRLKQIVRGGENKTDDEYELSSKDDLRFNYSVKAPFEFCKVLCYSTGRRLVYANLYAFAPTKPTVLKTKQDEFRVHKESSENDEFPNVLLIGVDSVSQLNFHRKFSKTRNFLIKELGGQEMYGYTKVADNTFVNLTPFFEGAFLKEVGWNETLRLAPFDDHDFVWKKYSNAGYLTLFSEDMPSIAIWNYLKEGFWKQPTDYYYRPFALAMEKRKVMWSKNRSCFGQRSETEMLLDYTVRFVKMAAGKPFFAFNFLTGATHDSINYHTDDLHLKFLKTLKASGVLNNTFVIYFSDHGMRYGSILNHYIGKIEERMPAMYIVPPTWFRKRYPQLSKNLKKNRNRLTTPFDMHETLRHLLNFKHSTRVVSSRKSKGHTQPRGISLLNSVPSNRSCSSAGVSEHWCPCLLSKPVSVQLHAVRSAAHSVVSNINKQLLKAGYSGKCAHLSLDKVTDAMLAKPSKKVLRFKSSVNDVIGKHVSYGASVNDSIAQYLVTVRTSPGGALFESTVQYDNRESSLPPNDIRLNAKKGHYTVLGDISRINAYGSTADCIPDHVYKKLCYCM